MSNSQPDSTPSLDLWFDRRIKKLRTDAANLREQANANDKAADILEHELKAFRLANPGADAAIEMSQPERSARPKAGRQIAPGSKSDQVIKIVQEAGTRGLKIAEILAAVNEKRISIKPNSLRGLVWSQKQAGRFVAANDRYYTPENAPQAIEPPDDLLREGGHQTAQ